jgi:hypothetical protein
MSLKRLPHRIEPKGPSCSNHSEGKKGHHALLPSALERDARLFHAEDSRRGAKRASVGIARSPCDRVRIPLAGDPRSRRAKGGRQSMVSSALGARPSSSGPSARPSSFWPGSAAILILAWERGHLGRILSGRVGCPRSRCDDLFPQATDVVLQIRFFSTRGVSRPIRASCASTATPVRVAGNRRHSIPPETGQ